MAIGTSGAISIGNGGAGSNTLNSEFGRSATTANSSLKELSDGTVGTINVANLNANKPDTSTPHAMSEFYKYEHVASVSTSPGTVNIASGAQSAATINVYTAQWSTWTVSDNVNWISLNGTSGFGDGSFTWTATENTGSARSGTITVTFTVGTTGGAHPGGANTTTTRTTTINQAAGSGGGGGGGKGGGGEP